MNKVWLWIGILQTSYFEYNIPFYIDLDFVCRVLEFDWLELFLKFWSKQDLKLLQKNSKSRQEELIQSRLREHLHMIKCWAVELQLKSINQGNPKQSYSYTEIIQNQIENDKTSLVAWNKQHNLLTGFHHQQTRRNLLRQPSIFWRRLGRF